MGVGGFYKISIVFSLITCGLFASSHAQAQAYFENSFINNQEKIFVEGFEIDNQTHCSAEDQYFCELAQAKPFQDEETLFIQRSIKSLFNKGLSSLITSIQAEGFFKIRRYTYGFSISPFQNNSLVRSESQFAFTDSIKKSFNFLDLFFNNPVKNDPISDADIKDVSFLHELIHARDLNGRFSTHPDFLRLAGFEEGDFVGTTLNEKEKVKNSIYNYKANNDHQNAYLLERYFGMSHGAPRLYSLESPAEFLADSAAFIVYDKTVNTYMDPELIRWIQSNVLLTRP